MHVSSIELLNAVQRHKRSLAGGSNLPSALTKPVTIAIGKKLIMKNRNFAGLITVTDVDVYGGSDEVLYATAELDMLERVAQSACENDTEGESVDVEIEIAPSKLKYRFTDGNIVSHGSIPLSDYIDIEHPDSEGVYLMELHGGVDKMANYASYSGVLSDMMVIEGRMATSDSYRGIVSRIERDDINLKVPASSMSGVLIDVAQVYATPDDWLRISGNQFTYYTQYSTDDVMDIGKFVDIVTDSPEVTVSLDKKPRLPKSLNYVHVFTEGDMMSIEFSESNHIGEEGGFKTSVGHVTSGHIDRSEARQFSSPLFLGAMSVQYPVEVYFGKGISPMVVVSGDGTSSLVMPMVKKGEGTTQDSAT